MKYLLVFILFCIIGFLMQLTYVLTGYFNTITTYKKQTFSSSHFSMAQAPADSLQATITTITGNVTWESRSATMEGELKSVRNLEQGEEITTGNTGSVTIQFPGRCLVQLFPNSDLNLVQTLPSQIVINQTTGEAEYTSIGICPLGIRSLGLLTSMRTADITLTVDTADSLATVNVLRGSALTGFEDTNNNTNIEQVGQGHEFVFDDSALTGIIQ